MKRRFQRTRLEREIARAAVATRERPGAREMSPTVLGSEGCLLQAASAINLKTLSFKDGREFEPKRTFLEIEVCFSLLVRNSYGVQGLTLGKVPTVGIPRGSPCH